MFLEYLSLVYNWLLSNGLILVFVYYAVRYRKYIYDKFVFTPLAGGNGKVQMDELVKGIVVAVFLYCVVKEATRTHEWSYFSDAFFGVLLGGIFAIAAIKPAMSVINSMRNDNGKDNESRAESDNSAGSGDKPVGDH